MWRKGFATNAAVAATDSFARVDRELERFRTGARATELDTTGWVTQQWQRFLGGLGGISQERLAELDAAFAFSRAGNSEVLCDWLLVAIAADYQPAYPALERFLLRVGRRKFLRPIYVELAKTEEGLAWARGVYARARPGYHAVSRNSIDQVLGWTAAGAAVPSR